LLCREVEVTVEGFVEVMPKLGGHDPLVPLSGHGLPQEFFGQMIAVALRGVKQIDAALGALIQDGLDLIRLVGLPPLAAQLPGTNAYDGNTEVTLS